VTVAQIKAREGGELGFLAQLRDSLKSGEYRPAEVRQVMIPKLDSAGNLGIWLTTVTQEASLAGICVSREILRSA